MKRYLPLLAIGLVAACGCRNGTSHANPNGKEATATPVTTTKPERKTLAQTTTQPGRIEPFEQTPLFARIEGYVGKTRTIVGKDDKKDKKPIADIGDVVKEGEVLAEVLVPEMEEEVKQKQALLDQAKAGEEQAAKSVLVAQKSAESASARVAEAKAGVLRAESDYAFWKAEHTRISELAASGSVTKKLVEEKLSQLKAAEAGQQVARAKVDSATAALAEAEANVGKAKADEAAAKARAKVAQADLDHTRALLAYATIRAPFDGVITQRNVDTGHFVRPPQGGAKPLFVLARNDIVRVVVEIPEKDAALIHVGSKANIHIGALGADRIKGEVKRTAWALDLATRTLRAEIDLPNKDNLLRPGLYATVQVTLKERPDALVIPFKAVVHDKDKGKTYCCRVDNGKIVREEITLGLRAGDEVEVLSGISESHQIVRDNAAALKHGQAVEVTNPK
jgi:RND family efflux transporter MFP subunit